MKQYWTTEADREFLIAERAAIMQYDGNLPREMAERLAREVFDQKDATKKNR